MTECELIQEWMRATIADNAVVQSVIAEGSEGTIEDLHPSFSVAVKFTCATGIPMTKTVDGTLLADLWEFVLSRATG